MSPYIKCAHSGTRLGLKKEKFFHLLQLSGPRGHRVAQPPGHGRA